MLRSIQRDLLIGVLGFVSLGAALAQTIERSESKGPQDPVEQLLESVPSVEQLCEGLAHEDAKTRIFAARCLASLGLNGKSASISLEAAATKSIEDYVGLKQKKVPAPQRPNRSGRLLSASDECAVALWAVTHDMTRFLTLIRKLATQGARSVSCPRRLEFDVLSAADRCDIEAMLRHSNPHVQETALEVVTAYGPRAEVVKNVLVEIARGRSPEVPQKAIEALAAIGPSAGPESAPILLAKWNDGTIPLQQFADAVGRLEIRSVAVQSILERGLHDNDQRAASSCAEALCRTSNQPTRAARLVTDAARDGAISNRFAIGVLENLREADDVVLPFLVAQLQSDDFWSRHDALNAIGSRGEKASEFIKPVESLLSDELALIRLKAAKVIFLVTNDPINLEKQLELAFANDDLADRYDAVETIGELNRRGARFTRYVLTELRQLPPDCAEPAIKALQAIGTEQAVAALRAAAESSDWILRSLATDALRNVRRSRESGGN